SEMDDAWRGKGAAGLGVGSRGRRVGDERDDDKLQAKLASTEPGNWTPEDVREDRAGLDANAFQGIIVKDPVDEIADGGNHPMLSRELGLVAREQGSLKPGEEGL